MKLLMSLSTLVLFLNIGAKAQETISDQELKKYAIAMDSIDAMRKGLVETISEMVKSNEQITAARYNELSKISMDEEKLAAAKATPEEITALKEIQATKDEGTARINETFQSLAKDYIGAATYNKVKKALASDEEVKARYAVIQAALNNKDAD